MPHRPSGSAAIGGGPAGPGAEGGDWEPRRNVLVVAPVVELGVCYSVPGLAEDSEEARHREDGLCAEACGCWSLAGLGNWGIGRQDVGGCT